jgi:hypothetical protein
MNVSGMLLSWLRSFGAAILGGNLTLRVRQNFPLQSFAKQALGAAIPGEMNEPMLAPNPFKLTPLLNQQLPLFSPCPHVFEFSVPAVTGQTVNLTAVVFFTVRRDERLGSSRQACVQKVDGGIYLTDFAASRIAIGNYYRTTFGGHQVAGFGDQVRS